MVRCVIKDGHAHRWKWDGWRLRRFCRVVVTLGVD